MARKRSEDRETDTGWRWWVTPAAILFAPSVALALAHLAPLIAHLL